MPLLAEESVSRSSPNVPGDAPGLRVRWPLFKLVQVQISQVVVGNLLGEHVIHGHQNFVGDSNRCSLVAAPGFETPT